ncbi:MAG: S26 family signal peptidase [Chloroflexi bacterium]|nr:S26 family signal peptidase [Chloroflexota bacterium]
MLLGLLKISGYSLAPAFQEGDYVLVSKLPLLIRGVRPGDVVVFDHPLHGRLIKLVDRLACGGNQMFLIGLNADSIDSRSFGLLPTSMAQGKVIWHFQKSK